MAFSDFTFILYIVLSGIFLYYLMKYVISTPYYKRVNENNTYEGFFGGVARGSGHPDCLRTLPESSELLDIIATASNDADYKELQLILSKLGCLKKDLLSPSGIVEATRYQAFETAHDRINVAEVCGMCLNQTISSRDLDIVLIKDQDLSDRLLPVGRLRESSAALKRADLVLNLDKDCHKKTSLSTKEIVFSREQTMAITTRAGSQDRYFEDLSQIIGFPLQRKEFQDHLSGEVLRKELLKLNAEIKVLILGMKEAVKLFSAEELLHHDLIHQKDFLNLNLSGRAFQVCLSKLDLEWDRSKFKALCEQKLKGFQT